MLAKILREFRAKGVGGAIWILMLLVAVCLLVGALI